ncbi:ankyrin [Daldinia caldariorum]|uniref:ankyrin n=1 Tax=Daldinia caldariorum TaxID=326644 RepID=UPI002008B8C7|nr:ankyrin [Daldinia caldariorum]KAI1472463.1 ankyrin [Daldinia caldariorum]
MANKARKVPQESWELHKETILSLYLTSDLSIEELVQAMEKDHKFFATLSQYEARLRDWKARKNLKKGEWELILPKIDQLCSRGIQTKVVIAGHPVPAKRIDRAKRYFKGDPERPRKRRRVEEDRSQAINSSDGNATIEVRDSDGNWVPYVDVPNEDVFSQVLFPDVNGVLELTEQEVQVEDSSARAVSDPAPIESISFPNMPRQPSPPHAMIFVSRDQSTSLEDQRLPQTAGFESQATQSLLNFEWNVNVTTSTLDSENYDPQMNNETLISLWSLFLEDLPFERFERGLLSRHLHFAHSPSPMGDCRLLSGAENGAMKFFFHAVTAMTNSNGKSADENLISARLSFQILETILPNPQRHYRNSHMTSLSQGKIEMCRILLYSVANGFSGTKDMPPKVILRFLDKNCNIIKLLPQLCQNSPNHAAKALAENLFRLCVESGNRTAIRLILKTGLVDVNKICCFAKGRKYTPMERLAELQELQAIHELLRFNADTNRTYSKLTPEMKPIYICGALEHLIYGLMLKSPPHSHSSFTKDWLDTVDALTQAGVGVQASHIGMAFNVFVRTDLAEKLLPQLMLAEHSEFISEERGLRLVAESFADEEAEKAFTKLLFNDCKRARCNQCLSRHADEISLAIYAGARRGHLQLVRSYFQYAKCSATVLAAAISSGNHELITFVLAQNPSMYPIYDGDHDGIPLVEAIKEGNDALLRELEARGALENLDKNDWNAFPRVLDAAANVGDIEYVKKLLILYPNFHPMRIVMAFESASRNAQWDIMHLLLDAGVDPAFFHKEGDKSIANIFVRAYDNKLLLSSLISAFPDFKIDGHDECNLLKEGLGSGNMDILDFFARSSMLGRAFLTSCLPIAVKRRDEAMLHRLLELGADVLTMHIKDGLFATDLHIGMLRILLQYVPSTETCIPLFGTQALIDAIETNIYNNEILNVFIDCKAVDLKSTTKFGEYWGDKASPLGVAIAKEAETYSSSFPLTRRLLDAGCDVNGIASITHCRKEGRPMPKTPLLKAIETRNKSLVQFIIDRGAQVNAMATLGIRRTPLQAAAEQGNLDIVQLLFRNGADVNANPATFEGRTALQCAAMSGNCNIAALLLDHCADLSAPPSPFNGRWPIEAAAEHGRLDMIQFLWNVSCGNGFPSEQCIGAIGLAKENGHRACADLIRELAVSNGIMLTLEGSE